jgi:hypothetical protein
MDIRYPVRKADGREYKNYDELMTDMRKNAHGWWLVGVNRYWHGGIHAGGASSPASVLSQNEPEKSVPLQSMMDGDVVAWRINRDYVRQPYDKTISLRHSGTFLLIKSVYKPDELDESSWLTLYQLYMHMAPLSEYPKRPMYRVTVQGNGVRMRRHSDGDEKREFAPEVIKDKHGEALTLKRGESLAVLQKVTFTLEGFPEPFALVQHVKDGRSSGSLFWASMRPEYLEPDGDCYIGLPAWMYNVLNHNVFDNVVIPPAPLKVTIKAGDPVGFLGAQDMMDEDNYPDMFSSEYKTHIELLSLDEHVPDFLANAKGIKTGKQFIKLKLKRPCYLRNGEGDDTTFSQMSAITRRGSGSILPRDTTHPFTDKEGVTYFQTGPHTWMHQDDVEQLSQHDLTGLNFQAIEAAPTTDFVHTLDETWLTEAFKSIATHFDSAKGPDSAQAKWFYNDLNRDLQIRDAGGMADWDKADLRKRLFAALHMTQMGIGELTRRLVVKHDSDWHSSAEDPRWSVFFKDRYIINQMKQINGGFLETTRWMDKVPPFTEHKSVWHFHPLEFLEILRERYEDKLRGKLTYDAEGNDVQTSQYYSRVVHWPGNALSGVTLGRGYDMGGRSESEVYHDMISSGIGNEQAKKISKGAGSKGNSARDFVSINKNDIGKITLSQQEALFDLIYPKYVEMAKSNYKLWVNGTAVAKPWNELDTVIQEVLVDFVYQGFTKGPKPMLAGSNNNKQELIDYIKNTSAISQYEPGRKRAKYLEDSK